jgi:hypothetical protein
MARIKYYDASSASWKYADKAGSTTVTVDGITAIPAPETAAVGQTVVVKSIDSNGKPVEWEAADSSSGNVSYYEETYTTTEPLNSYTINLPVLMRDFYEIHVHATWGKLDQTFTLYIVAGGHVRIGELPIGNDVGTHLYFTTSPIHGRMFATFNSNVISINTYPGNLGASVNVQDTTTIQFYSHNGGLDIPAGTVFKVWGVYHK